MDHHHHHYNEQPKIQRNHINNNNYSNLKRSRSLELFPINRPLSYYDESSSSDGTGNRHANGTLSCSENKDSGLASDVGCEEVHSVQILRVPFKELYESTIAQHYYPEGGWGYIIIFAAMCVHMLVNGLQLSYGVILPKIQYQFLSVQFIKVAVDQERDIQLPVNTTFKFVTIDGKLAEAGSLGAFSMTVASFLSPITISYCKKKSTRLAAVMGGLVTALGLLFTSFATQFHQLFISYGLFMGLGVSMTRDSGTLMVSQYFKRKREIVEIFIVAGSGLGLAAMSAYIRTLTNKFGWRLGLQAVTLTVLLTFFLGLFYRSASLYHPQRRAILHLKNQKRKVKEKNKVNDRPKIIDYSPLKSITLRIILACTALISFGLYTPLIYLAYFVEKPMEKYLIEFQVHVGIAWAVGCCLIGFVVVINSADCRISRQNWCQICTIISAISIFCLSTISTYEGYVAFAWFYGLSCGGYNYALKVLVLEKVRTRNFSNTWGFVQFSQSIPMFIGVPLAGYLTDLDSKSGYRVRYGYYMSAGFVLLGSLSLFLINMHKRRLAKHKHTAADGIRHVCHAENCPERKRRKLSFTDEDANGHAGGVLASGSVPATAAAAAAAALLGQRSLTLANIVSGDLKKAELTCISEEGIADMDLDLEIPDNLLDDLDYIGDCITSCNKVENYLMLSEYENNLIAETPVLTDRKGRRWSIQHPRKNTQQPSLQQILDNDSPGPSPPDQSDRRRNREVPPFRNANWRLLSTTPKRPITVIDEASV